MAKKQVKTRRYLKLFGGETSPTERRRQKREKAQQVKAEKAVAISRLIAALAQVDATANKLQDELTTARRLTREAGKWSSPIGKQIDKLFTLAWADRVDVKQHTDGDGLFITNVVMSGNGTLWNVLKHLTIK